MKRKLLSYSSLLATIVEQFAKVNKASPLQRESFAATKLKRAKMKPQVCRDEGRT